MENLDLFPALLQPLFDVFAMMNTKHKGMQSKP